jgi:hypothetical protein
MDDGNEAGLKDRINVKIDVNVEYYVLMGGKDLPLSHHAHCIANVG